MPLDWAENTAQGLLRKGLLQKGICLILGGPDTGKTTLAEALAKQAASNQPVGIVDADIGQSHIGPPTTVGWAVVNNPQSDFSQLAAAGISFVGDVTPVGHLLQLTAAILQCAQQTSKVAELTIVDTPGFIYGPAASALWWTVQRTLKPTVILAVQRENELSDILAGLQSLEPQIELLKSPPQIPTKSPQNRRSYREKLFRNYFQNSHLYNISLNNVAVQMNRNLSSKSRIHRLAGLRNKKGIDVAIGIITNWPALRQGLVRPRLDDESRRAEGGQNDKGIITVKAPKVDIEQIRCLVIGDVAINIPDE